MNELIKLTQQTLDNIEVNTVNARELHENLEISTRYNDWIKNRIEKYGFKENKDYLCLTENLVTQTSTGRQGSSSRITHYISLDMAKELCMVENNEKGREAREYFIECEKKLQTILKPKQHCFLDIIEAADEIDRVLAIRKLDQTIIKPLEAKVEAQAEELAEAAPKVKYYDLVLSCPNTVPIRNIAQDYGWSAQKMNKKLNELGIQYKQGKIWVLTTSYLTQGYARLETIVLNPETPKQAVVQSLKWTQKGRLMIYEILKSEGILPVCERDDILGES